MKTASLKTFTAKGDKINYDYVVTNNGTLKQTQTVNTNSAFDFLNVSTNKYYGVKIANGSGLGSTTGARPGRHTGRTGGEVHRRRH